MSRGYTETLARAGRELLIALSPSGDVLWCSDNVEAILGSAEAGRPLSTILEIIDGVPLVEVLHEVRQDCTVRWTPTVRGRDGEPRHLDALLRGEPDDWISVVARDITAEVRLAAIGELAAGIGHDLRNPLAAIKNALHYLSRRLPAATTEPRILQYVELARGEVHNCEQQIAGMLDYARDAPTQTTMVAVATLVADAVSIVKTPAHVTIDVQVPADLPAIQVDAVQLRRVLVNLVQNACEAVPATRAGTVRVGGAAAEDAVSIEVADDGDGMTPEVRARLFDPLFTTKPRGTGLGLAIVARIVERHGGTVTVESTVGAGSVFVLRLPTTVSKP